MSLENRLAAEFYAIYHPWIDHAQPVRFMADVAGNVPQSQPDLCFWFRGGLDEFRIEFKTLSSGIGFKATNNQVNSWTPPAMADEPDVWVVIDQFNGQYLVWKHANMIAPLLAAAPTAGTHRTINFNLAAATVVQSQSLAALEVLKIAQAAGKLV